LKKNLDPFIKSLKTQFAEEAVQKEKYFEVVKENLEKERLRVSNTSTCSERRREAILKEKLCFLD
jgi:hypothetical protein